MKLAGKITNAEGNKVANVWQQRCRALQVERLDGKYISELDRVYRTKRALEAELVEGYTFVDEIGA